MKKYILYVVLLGIAEISLALYLTEWRAIFWDYVSQRNLQGFYNQLGVFTIVALLFCFCTAYASYFTTLCAIDYRKVLNARAIKVVHGAENLNQRIQEDCRDYADLLFNIGVGLVKSVVYIIGFSVFLVLYFNMWYLVAIMTYAIVSTLLAKWIAKPLINLNYNCQVAEATYRNGLTLTNFTNCIEVMTGLALKTKKLAYFQTFYGQLAVILPILIVAPAYFSAAITLGALMQARALMGTISDSTSYGIVSFNLINKFLSCSRRLKEIGVIA